MSRRLFAILALLIATACTATNDTEQRAIEEVLAKRANALNHRDISLYLSTISPAYHDKEKDFTALKRELESNFRSFSTINYRSWDRKVKITGNRATATGRYDLRLPVKGSPVTLSGQEDIHLIRDAAGWKISSGL
ncbi:MAG: nuclear transport factor 2 family protein [Geobacter sp.]|nr:nuclear transport factor 2 family protein [Geobacter sp.]